MRKGRLHNYRITSARKLAFSLTALLLFAQWSALVHAASYGFDDHAHNGVTCEISIVSEKLDDLAPPDAGPIIWPPRLTDDPANVWIATKRSFLLAAHPRGPPSYV